MFNLSGSEIIFILLLALVVLGPEKLPDALRRAGRTYAELKKMGSTFESEVRGAFDEPMKEMRETADMLRKAASFDGEDGDDGGGAGRDTKPRVLLRDTGVLPPEQRHKPAPADGGAPEAPDAPPVDGDTMDAEPVDDSSVDTVAADDADDAPVEDVATAEHVAPDEHVEHAEPEGASEGERGGPTLA